VPCNISRVGVGVGRREVPIKGDHMKKWVVLAVAMMMVAGVQAQEKAPMTKADFIAAQQKRAEAKGKEFDLARAEEMFAKRDKNGDGVLTADEQVGNKDRGGKGDKGGKGGKGNK